MRDNEFSLHRVVSMFESTTPEFFLRLFESAYPNGEDQSWKDQVMNLAEAIITALCYKRDRGEIELSVETIRERLALTDLVTIQHEAKRNNWNVEVIQPLLKYLDALPGFHIHQIREPELWPPESFTTHSYITKQFISTLNEFMRLHGSDFIKRKVNTIPVSFPSVSQSKRAMVSVRIDEGLKQHAEAVMAELGLTATDAITQLYRFVAEHHKMPVVERVFTYQNTDQNTIAEPKHPAEQGEAESIILANTGASPIQK